MDVASAAIVKLQIRLINNPCIVILKSEGNPLPPVKQQHMVGGVGPFRSRASQILDQLVDRHRR